MNKVVKFAVDRLKEPSTWAGLAIFVGKFGLGGGTVSRIVQNGPAIVTAAAAVVAVVLPSTQKTVDNEPQL